MVHSKLLFVIDDDGDDLQMMDEIINDIGHQCRFFRSGTEMFSYLKENPKKPDMIFLDVSMPLEDGYEVLQKIRSSHNLRYLPVIIHSANCDPKCVTRCYELGANYFLPKAFSISDIKHSLQHVLDKDWKSFKARREEFVYQNN